MTKETILNYPDFNKVFEIHIDASWHVSYVSHRNHQRRVQTMLVLNYVSTIHWMWGWEHIHAL